MSTFKRKCGFINHVDNKSSCFDYRKHKKIKQETLNYFFENELLNKRSRYMCKECLCKNDITDSQNQSNNTNSSNITYNEENDGEDNLVNHNKDEDLYTELFKILSADVTKLYKDRPCKSSTELAAYDAKEWL